MERYLPERVQRGEEALWSEPAPKPVQSFLRKRYPWGGDAETLRRFHIGLEPNSWGLPAVLFPMRQLDGSWFYSRRSVLEGPKYEHEMGETPPLYLPLPPQERVVYLTEGHSDTLTARWLGFKSMGLMGTSQWKLHLDYLQKFDEVRVVMDADHPGWKTAGELYRHLCNVRLIFVYEPSIFFDAKTMLTPTQRRDPRCAAKEPGHGEHKGACRIWLESYGDLKLDLSDLTMKWPEWARLLLTEGEGDLFAPGHRACGYASREGCRRCGTRLEGERVPQARLPRAEALPRPEQQTGLRSRPRYLGAGW